MNRPHVLLTFKKELRETVRDRRTLAVMVLFPLVVYPLLAVLTTQVAARRELRLAEKQGRVSAPADSELATDLARLSRQDGSAFAFVPGKRKHDVESGAIDVYAERAPTKDAAAPAETGARPVRLYFDGTREESSRTRERVAEALAARLPEGCQPVFSVDSRDVASDSATGGYLLSKILPLLIVLMLMLGAFYPAIDTTAGERERGTLETTLVAPVRRFDLLLGKVLAVAVLALVTGLLNLGSMSLTLMQALELVNPAMSLPIPWLRMAAVAVLLLPIALLFAALMVTVATSARSFKEAQNLLTPLYFLVFIPAAIASLGDYPLSAGLALVPGLNVTLLTRDVILGRSAALPIVLVVTSTVAYTGVAMALAARLFDPERLLAVDDSRAGGPTRGARPPAPEWNAGDALVLFSAGFVLLFLLAPLQLRLRELGVLVAQWLGMFGLTLGYVRLRRQDVARLIAWRPARAGALLGALVMGGSAWLAAGLLSEWILPPPPELIESMKKELLAQGERPLVVTLLVVALTPAICEEVLFRGGILRGLLPRFGTRTAIVICAVMFAVFHLNIYRLLPTFALGLMLSWIAFASGSLLPSMLAHLVNNGVLIVMASRQMDTQIEDISPGMQAALFVGSLLVAAFGGYLIHRTGRRAAAS